MSVRELGQEVVSHMWLKLKSLGFRRKAATFFRDGPQVGERYAIDGNRWNSGVEPWVFSVSVGVFFLDLPPLANAKGLWRHAHAVGSTDTVVPGTESFFEVSRVDVEAVSVRVVEVVLRASEALPPLWTAAYPRARQGLISPLPVPQSWATSRTDARLE